MRVGDRLVVDVDDTSQVVSVRRVKTVAAATSKLAVLAV